MPVITAPVNTITLKIDTQQIECQVVSHALEWADASAGDQTRTGCGDVVTIPADSTEVATLALTVFDDRAATGFSVWTRMHHGETADFVLIEHFDVAGTDTALEYSGKATVSAVPVKQDAYTKIETVDVSWSVTELTNIATVPTP